MSDELIDLEEQIDRRRRFLADEKMRDSLEELAQDYEARLKRPSSEGDAGFMLRDRD